MKVFIIGGTGFLGYYSALEFLRRGHQVSTLSIPDVKLDGWFPREIKTGLGDIFKMGRGELTRLFSKQDALVYAVGPDDRVVPDSPAYSFFHDRLVTACGRVVSAAADAGVRRCVVLNSYFCLFDRLWPWKKLAENHPYIRCRVEQAEAVIRAGAARGKTKKMDVMVLELPYIFGSMPGRVPLWKDVLLDRIRAMNPVFFTKGGTNMIAVEHVAEAVAGAVEKGRHGSRYTVGDVNMDWKEMLAIMLGAMGLKRRVITVPAFIAAFYGRYMKKKYARAGKESGLDHARLFRDIQSEYLYYDPSPAAEVLGHGRGGVRESIIKTVRACENL